MIQSCVSHIGCFHGFQTRKSIWRLIFDSFSFHLKIRKHLPTTEIVAMSDTLLRIEGLTKNYESETALQDVSLNLNDDEIMTMIGPSGCGKTTLLRIIAGLERPDSGRVILDGTVVSDRDNFVAPETRDVGFVFQDLALFPHLTVTENVAFGLNKSLSETTQTVNEMLELVGLSDYGDRYPNDLSGGQKQRVALARSLGTEPSLLLMDEPFSNLDKELHQRLRKDVLEILKRVEIPTLFVTHDQEDALFLGDTTAVMSTATIEQIDKPQTLVTHPTNRFVAEFLGPTEFVSAERTNGTIKTEFDTLPADQVNGFNQREFQLMVRGDDIRIEPVDKSEQDGVIENAEFLGAFFRYKIRLNSGNYVYSLLNHSNLLSDGTPVCVQIEPGHSLMGFKPRSKPA